MQWIIGDSKVEPKISAYHLIDSSGQLNASERLTIYARGYVSRIVESLESDFPTTRQILGEERFFSLVENYLKKYPSRTQNINEIGRFLPHFVKKYQYQKGLHKEIPYLYDIINLEWQIIESFYANHVPNLDINELLSISEDQWSSAHIVLDPSVRLMKCQWPAHQLWQNRESRNFDSIKSAFRQNFVNLCLYRFNGNIFINNITTTEKRLLILMQKGHLLADIVQKMRIKNSNHLMNYFAQWTKCGIIKQISYSCMIFTNHLQ